MAKLTHYTADEDRKLFLAILKVHDVKIDYEKVAAEISNGTVHRTSIAVSRRMDRLRKMASAPAEYDDFTFFLRTLHFG